MERESSYIVSCVQENKRSSSEIKSFSAVKVDMIIMIDKYDDVWMEIQLNVTVYFFLESNGRMYTIIDHIF